MSQEPGPLCAIVRKRLIVNVVQTDKTSKSLGLGNCHALRPQQRPNALEILHSRDAVRQNLVSSHCLEVPCPKIAVTSMDPTNGVWQCVCDLLQVEPTQTMSHIFASGVGRVWSPQAGRSRIPIGQIRRTAQANVDGFGLGHNATTYRREVPKLIGRRGRARLVVLVMEVCGPRFQGTHMFLNSLVSAEICSISPPSMHMEQKRFRIGHLAKIQEAHTVPYEFVVAKPESFQLTGSISCPTVLANNNSPKWNKNVDYWRKPLLISSKKWCTFNSQEIAKERTTFGLTLRK